MESWFGDFDLAQMRRVFFEELGFDMKPMIYKYKTHMNKTCNNYTYKQWRTLLFKYIYLLQFRLLMSFTFTFSHNQISPIKWYIFKMLLEYNLIKNECTTDMYAYLYRRTEQSMTPSQYCLNVSVQVETMIQM